MTSSPSSSSSSSSRFTFVFSIVILSLLLAVLSSSNLLSPTSSSTTKSSSLTASHHRLDKFIDDDENDSNNKEATTTKKPRSQFSLALSSFVMNSIHKYLRDDVFFSRSSSNLLKSFTGSIVENEGKHLCILLLMSFDRSDVIFESDRSNTNNVNLLQQNELSCEPEFVDTDFSSTTSDGDKDKDAVDFYSSYFSNFSSISDLPEKLLPTSVSEEIFTALIKKCVNRVGIEKFGKILNPKCTTSTWWKDMFVVAKSSSSMNNNTSIGDVNEQLPQDYTRQAQTIFDSSSFSNNENQQQQQPKNRKYIPPSERSYAISSSAVSYIDFTLRPPHYALHSSREQPLRAYPITFGLPKNMIHKSVSRMKFISVNPVAPSWLGGRKNYPRIPKHLKSKKGQAALSYAINLDEEHTLAQLYRHSYFGFDMHRGGSDSQRHLEILARGCVPLYPDFEFRCYHKNSTCLAFYPRELIKEALEFIKSQPATASWARNGFENEYFARGKVWINVKNLPSISTFDATSASVYGGDGSSASNSTSVSPVFDEEKYFDIADRLLKFTQKHLSCGAIVSYLLKTAGIEEPKNVFIFLPRIVDYLSLCIEQGFAELGINYTTNEHDYHDGYGISESVAMSMIPNNDQLGNEDFVKSMAPSSSSSFDRTEDQNSNSSSSTTSVERTTSTTVEVTSVWPPWQKRFNYSVASKMTFEDWTRVHTDGGGSEPFFLGHKYGMEKMYGRGFVWGMRVEPPPNKRVPLFNPKNLDALRMGRKRKRNNNNSLFRKSELQERLERKEFDLVVYSALFLFKKGRFHSNVSLNLPYLKTIRDAYEGEWNRVLFCDGDDVPLEAQHWGPLLEEMVTVRNNNNNNKDRTSSPPSSKMFVRESFFLNRKMKRKEELPQWF